MIKGFVGCKVRKDKDFGPFLLKLRSHAMQFQGFKGMESLVGEENASLVAVVSTWESLEDWKSWIQSTITQELLREAHTLLTEAPRVSAYMIMLPAVTWV